jgi:hypothetical protein
MNEKSLFEMDNARLRLAEANQLLSECKAKVQQSQASFDEATACSVNRDAACYQEVTENARKAYQTLNDAIVNLEQAFTNPTIQRMIQAATDKF